MGWDWVNKYYGPQNPLSIAFFYGISLFNDDGMLPAIAAAITYGFSFAILYKASKKTGSTFNELTIAYWFFMLNMNFLYVTTVIRFYVAFSIMAYFLYMDIIEKKRRPLCFAIYITLCFFHYAMLVFVLLRFVFIFSRKMKGTLAALGTVFVPLVLMIGYTFIENFGGSIVLFQNASNKLQGYEEYEVFGIWQFLASMVREVVFVFICILAVWVCKKLREKENRNALKSGELKLRMQQIGAFNDFTVFCLYLTVTVFTFITNFQFVLRTPYFVQTMISVVLLLVMAEMKNLDIKINAAVKTVIITESILHQVYLMVYVYGALEFA